jgi:hypothetical protein
MTITNTEQYNIKKSEFDSKYATFIAEFNRLKAKPCVKYSSNSTGIDGLCLDDIWRQSGCDKKSPYTPDNTSNNTLYDIINDAYKWSSFSYSNHPNMGCYTSTNAVANTTKNYNVNDVTFTTINGSTFTKDGKGISVSNIEDCKEKCLPETGCISATYNSSSKKCWTNFGSLSDWKEPMKSSYSTDVAIYYGMFQMINQLSLLNKELYEYEISSVTGSGNNRHLIDESNSTSYDSGHYSSDSYQSSNTGQISNSDGKPPDAQSIFDTIFQIAPTVIQSLFGETNNSVEPNEFAALKQKVGVIDTDRIATAKTLEEYKKQLIEMSKQQEDSNAELKKQLISIALITVIGILLILLLSAIIQSMNSGPPSFSGGGKMRNCLGKNCFRSILYLIPLFFIIILIIYKS